MGRDRSYGHGTVGTVLKETPSKDMNMQSGSTVQYFSMKSFANVLKISKTFSMYCVIYEYYQPCDEQFCFVLHEYSMWYKLT